MKIENRVVLYFALIMFGVVLGKLNLFLDNHDLKSNCVCEVAK